MLTKHGIRNEGIREMSNRMYRCPHCGNTVREDELVEVEDFASDVGMILSAPPPKHMTVNTEIDGIVPVTTIRYRRFSPIVIFLIPFTMFWSGMSMTGIYGSQIARHAFDLKLSLFGLPFLIGSIVLVSICLFGLFGKRVLTLSAGQGRYFTGIGPIGWTRRFTYNRATMVAEDESVAHGRHGTTVTSFIRLTNKSSADSIKICSGFGDDALRYAAAVIRRECSRV